MLCVLILYKSGGTYSLRPTPNYRFFETLFMAVLFYSQSFCQNSSERKSPKKYFLYFVYIYSCSVYCCIFVNLFTIFYAGLCCYICFIFVNFVYNTYIHNWPLQPFSKNYGLDSHRSLFLTEYVSSVRG